jgi:hypothetical protein
MDPRRIEEIRRKLREGRKVHVIGGKPAVDGVPGGQTPASVAGAQGGAGTPAPEGVLVKPHEWGAAAAEELPFYTTAAGETRVLQEQALLVREYPGFELEISDDGTPYAHGFIGPTAELANRYHVLLVIPPGYGRGVMPKVYVVVPELRQGAPHTFTDGGLCLDHSGAFTKKSTLITLLAWVSVWLVLYEGWLETGQAW